MMPTIFNLLIIFNVGTASPLPTLQLLSIIFSNQLLLIIKSSVNSQLDTNAQFDNKFWLENFATLPYFSNFKGSEVVKNCKNQTVHTVHVVCEKVLKLCIKYILILFILKGGHCFTSTHPCYKMIII